MGNSDFKCPYCKTDMHIGFIANNRGTDIAWTPAGEKQSRGFHCKSNEICLKKGNLWTSTLLKVYHCQICHLFIIDQNDTTYSNKELPV